MNNIKSIVTKEGIQLSIYISVRCYVSAYYLILLYIHMFYNKRVFKCEITSSLYPSALQKYSFETQGIQR